MNDNAAFCMSYVRGEVTIEDYVAAGAPIRVINAFDGREGRPYRAVPVAAGRPPRSADLLFMATSTNCARSTAPDGAFGRPHPTHPRSHKSQGSALKRFEESSARASGQIVNQQPANKQEQGSLELFGALWSPLETSIRRSDRQAPN